MEETLGRALLEEHSTISNAESCTSGLVGKLLTNVSGSSESTTWVALFRIATT